MNHADRLGRETVLRDVLQDDQVRSRPQAEVLAADRHACRLRDLEEAPVAVAGAGLDRRGAAVAIPRA
ncbi:hypothetical protein ABZS95_33185 [Streptomyces sp. NPDC005479]|uniref:hypothetical protein n=1 Tax=unclassified Streptomyces TaxID=2593676 RepID=UPI0033A8D124